MLGEIAGVQHVDTLYVQLLYACNYRCGHCFHGEKLDLPDQVTMGQYVDVMNHFRDTYGTRRIVLLGGEPFLHPDIDEMLEWAHRRDWQTEICTNGHRFTHAHIRRTSRWLSHLRVSIDGLQTTHDALRQRGSFRHALRAIEVGREEELRTGVTLTVNSDNIAEIPTIADTVRKAGASDMTLHRLRLVGNAIHRPELAEVTEHQLRTLVNWARACDTIQVSFDDDLDPRTKAPVPMTVDRRNLARIEMDPEFGFTMSCKAVGTSAQAFRWSTSAGKIVYEPSSDDEIQLKIPDVRYI